MKYLTALTLILSACSTEREPISLPELHAMYYVDVTTLPECSASILKLKGGFCTFQLDNGDVLYSASKGGAMCLKRKIR
jgi:hypothetical protein